jgi:hypothetical protein
MLVYQNRRRIRNKIKVRIERSISIYDNVLRSEREKVR